MTWSYVTTPAKQIYKYQLLNVKWEHLQIIISSSFSTSFSKVFRFPFANKKNVLHNPVSNINFHLQMKQGPISSRFLALSPYHLCSNMKILNHRKDKLKVRLQTGLNHSFDAKPALCPFAVNRLIYAFPPALNSARNHWHLVRHINTRCKFKCVVILFIILSEFAIFACKWVDNLWFKY